MNRPRRKDECYRCYRRHQKEESIELKNRLKPRVIWVSSIVMPDPKESDLPEYLRKLVKVPVRGTFNRSMGHTMPQSLVDKHKRERVVAKLRRKGIMK